MAWRSFGHIYEERWHAIQSFMGASEKQIVAFVLVVSRDLHTVFATFAWPAPPLTFLTFNEFNSSEVKLNTFKFFALNGEKIIIFKSKILKKNINTILR